MSLFGRDGGKIGTARQQRFHTALLEFTMNFHDDTSNNIPPGQHGPVVQQLMGKFHVTGYDKNDCLKSLLEQVEAHFNMIAEPVAGPKGVE